jgi:hypothetical protein
MTAAARSKLTVLVGAGGSVPLGVPSTATITELVKSALVNFKPRRDEKAEYPELASRFMGAASRYYGKLLNFEHLLDLMESGQALAWGWARPGGATTSEACLTRARTRLKDVVEYYFLSHCVFELKKEVLRSVTTASSDVADHPAWPRYKAFWSQLASEFDLTIVTLNYDTLIEQALKLDGSHQGFAPVSGERTWRLHPRTLHDPQKHRLLHLHGSIQFGGRGYGSEPNRFCYEDSFHDLYWHPTVESAQQTLWGKSSPRAGSGRTLEGGPIVTGLHKPDKLLHEPLASYYVAAANQLRTCPRLLVIGYGFGDPHINMLLSRMTRNHGDARRVACIDFVDMVERYGSYDQEELLLSLQRWGECRFEYDDRHTHPWTSANARAQFYYKGLLDAVERADGLIAFLRGDHAISS